MKVKLLLLVLFLLITGALSAQIQTSTYFPADKKYREFIDETGNPLPGNPVMIIQSFVPNYGSYVWYLNENRAKKSSFLDADPKDLFGGIYLEDHGGLLEQITFKDFAQGLAQPIYLLSFCQVTDADHNGFPEFYLTYFEESDGLDAKPLKVLVYTQNKDKKIVKAKLTGWIAYQEEDSYREEEDANFKQLSQAIRLNAQKLLKSAQQTLN